MLSITRTLEMKLAQDLKSLCRATMTLGTKDDIAGTSAAEGCWGLPGSCLVWRLGTSHQCISLLFLRNSNRSHEGSQQVGGDLSV